MAQNRLFAPTICFLSSRQIPLCDQKKIHAIALTRSILLILKIFKIELRFDKRVFRVLALDGFGELGIHEGNILSGFFHVLGKVKRREE